VIKPTPAREKLAMKRLVALNLVATTSAYQRLVAKTLVVQRLARRTRAEW